jgi:oligopeptide/dipeptide ABC transporter ATP-binding protein
MACANILIRSRLAVADTLLSVQSLSVAFRSRGQDFLALDEVSFDVAAGEVFGLVGESGSGKSATALAIMQLLPQPPAHIRNGVIQFEDQNLLSLGNRALDRLRGHKIGMIFQEPMTSLNPVLTIGKQIAEPLRLHLGLDAGAARRRVLELLDRVRIPAATSRIDAYPHELSGGLRQRVMIAIAISCNPRLLIADEPTTALDVTVQAQVIELLREIQRETGMAVIMITHDLGLIADFAQRVAVMYAGRVVEIGPVHEFFHHPRHPYTAALIDSIPDPQRESARLVTIEGQVPKLSALPPGCRFAPRCSFYQTACDSVVPDLYLINAHQRAACIRPFDYVVPPRA